MGYSNIGDLDCLIWAVLLMALVGVGSWVVKWLIPEESKDEVCNAEPRTCSGIAAYNNVADARRAEQVARSRAHARR